MAASPEGQAGWRRLHASRARLFLRARMPSAGLRITQCIGGGVAHACTAARQSCAPTPSVAECRGTVVAMEPMWPKR
eukprot:2979256-Prymnesium_polylepis.1